MISRAARQRRDIRVVFSDETIVPAKIVGRDPATDLAVLKVAPGR